jgi:hypothetical protein
LNDDDDVVVVVVVKKIKGEKKQIKFKAFKMR